VHLPLIHCIPYSSGQIAPQLPQFIALDFISTHTPPQQRSLDNEHIGLHSEQIPETQVSPSAHTVPQFPQLELFVVLSTQTPLQHSLG
jgi:hypothetical protein